MATGIMRTHEQGRSPRRPAVGTRRVGGLVAAAALSGVALTGTSLVLAGPGGVAGATSPHQTVHISTAKVPSVGTVLTTSAGLTLYRFANDPTGTATCTGACAKIWPPVLASKGAHIAGPKGVKGLSLIKVGSHFQLAFHNVALYRFTGDKEKGQAKGQGVANVWFAVLRSGVPASTNQPASVTPTPAATPTPATPATPAPTTTTSRPAPQTPMNQAPPATPPTTPPTTTPTTAPPTTTTTQPSSAGGGGVSF
jgi:predicted lipoprotein with Yx(FWY)xxD motif